jgi:hypothetical protein
MEKSQSVCYLERVPLMVSLILGGEGSFLFVRNYNRRGVVPLLAFIAWGK